MRFYRREQWYRIPESETVILNTNYLCGKHRFVKRTMDVKASYAQVRPVLEQMPKADWQAWNVGSGYEWEPPNNGTYFWQ